jgi:endonuclease/exonuclease/phosphatase family metal-dependent hydrolase
MRWLFLLLAGCGLVPHSVSYPEDSGVPWVIPEEYSDPGALQVATFNADWLWASTEAGYYPRNAVDYAMLARLFTDFDLELVALQEINGDGAMALLELGPEWSWALGETGWSQNPGLLWRNDRVLVDNVREIHLEVNEWPSKDPLAADVSALDGSLAFTVVVVHNKPYADIEDARQRYTQAEQLHAWITQELALEEHRAPFHDHVLIAGDFNDAFLPLNSSFPSLEIFDEDPWFEFLTHDTDGYSQVSYRSLIDHLVVSQPLLGAYAELGEPDGCKIIAHDEISPWADYDGGFGGDQNISDHRPVWAFLQIESGSEP